MTKLSIVANIIAKTDQVELVKTELLKLVDITRAEEGCVTYDLHQDNEQVEHFMFYEVWETRELWEAHMSNKHLVDYVVATEDAIEEFTLNEMTHIA